VIQIGDEQFRVRHTPGHTLGHACFEFDTPDGLGAFVGDVVLPVYTPNVGGADVRVDRPLEQLLRSLHSLERRQYDCVWPGHRSQITDPNARIREIVDHHVERMERILTILRDEGTADPWEVSSQLFGTLEGVHIMHGPGEAYAHLEHLERNGILERNGREYEIVAEPGGPLDEHVLSEIQIDVTSESNADV
jgi:glyoxylase-like metal-dependent hydrolase (beta-lactamase superfamily II)